jgi:hypothetical protein
MFFYRCAVLTFDKCFDSMILLNWKQYNPGPERLTRIARLLFQVFTCSSGDLTGEARAAKALSQVLKLLQKTPGKVGNCSLLLETLNCMTHALVKDRGANMRESA